MPYILVWTLRKEASIKNFGWVNWIKRLIFCSLKLFYLRECVCVFVSEVSFWNVIKNSITFNFRFNNYASIFLCFLLFLYFGNRESYDNDTLTWCLMMMGWNFVGIMINRKTWSVTGMKKRLSMFKLVKPIDVLCFIVKICSNSKVLNGWLRQKDLYLIF